MLQKQSLRLDESQEHECQQLSDTLQYELDILRAYQTKNKTQAEAQRDRERKELQERVSIRRSLLESKVRFFFIILFLKLKHIFKMEMELQQFEQERKDRMRLNMEKHTKELEAFDDESIALGFR